MSRPVSNFLYEVTISICKTIKVFLIDLWKNWPATCILVLATIGVATLLSSLPIEAYFLSAGLIDETMVSSIIAIGVIYGLSLLTVRVAKE